MKISTLRYWWLSLWRRLGSARKPAPWCKPSWLWRLLHLRARVSLMLSLHGWEGPDGDWILALEAGSRAGFWPLPSGRDHRVLVKQQRAELEAYEVVDDLLAREADPDDQWLALTDPEGTLEEAGIPVTPALLDAFEGRRWNWVLT